MQTLRRIWKCFYGSLIGSLVLSMIGWGCAGITPHPFEFLFTWGLFFAVIFIISVLYVIISLIMGREY